MNKTLLTCIFFLGHGCSLFGQNKAEESIEISIYAFDYARGHETIFLANKKGTPLEVKLSNANILGPFKTVKDANSRVSIRTQKKNKDGVVVYPAITKFTIAQSIKRPLVILFPVKGDEVYKALVIDLSVSNFPKGSYTLVNFSTNDIRGLVGMTKITAPSKKITRFNPSNNLGEFLDVHFQFKRKSGWKTFGRTRWVNEKEKRSLLCAYLDPRTKRMKIRGLVIHPLSARRESKQTAL